MLSQEDQRGHRQGCNVNGDVEQVAFAYDLVWIYGELVNGDAKVLQGEDVKEVVSGEVADGRQMVSEGVSALSLTLAMGQGSIWHPDCKV